jgi:Tfp pilus assembly protein PilF
LAIGLGMNRLFGLAWVAASTWAAVLRPVYAEELSAEEYAARAVQSVKEGKQAEAQADFDKAVELAPDKPIVVVEF